MNANRLLPRITTWVLLAAGLTLGASVVFAYMDGRTGKAQSSTGCSCHGTTATSGVVVTITGPQVVAPSSTHQYTVTVSGGPAAPNGGFDLLGSGGTFTAGANNRVSGSEVTHSNPDARSWTFSWTAPATTGTQNFWAIGLAADGALDTSSDDWNWYGGVVNTAFPITVTTATAVGDPASATWLAPPLPNPCVNGARVSFSLANAADVRLAILDAAGRNVRTLVRGAMPAGPQSVTWNGRSANGARVAPGVYFLRLTTPDRELTQRVTVAH